MEEGFLASLNVEQRIRYYNWWRKYLILKYAWRMTYVLVGVVCILQL